MLFADSGPETLSFSFFSTPPLSDTVGCYMAQPITVFFPIFCRKCLHHSVTLLYFTQWLERTFPQRRKGGYSYNTQLPISKVTPSSKVTNDILPHTHRSKQLVPSNLICNNKSVSRLFPLTMQRTSNFFPLCLSSSWIFLSTGKDQSKANQPNSLSPYVNSLNLAELQVPYVMNLAEII